MAPNFTLRFLPEENPQTVGACFAVSDVCGRLILSVATFFDGFSRFSFELRRCQNSPTFEDDTARVTYACAPSAKIIARFSFTLLYKIYLHSFAYIIF